MLIKKPHKNTIRKLDQGYYLKEETRKPDNNTRHSKQFLPDDHFG